MDNSHTQYDIAVIGAGASGLTAAVAAARKGRKVCLIESNQRVGRKILETGNGRCNLSHKPIDGTEYRGSGTDRLPGFLKRFGVDETLDFFRSIGLMTREREGYVYPYSETASSVLDVLRFSVEDAGTVVYTDRRVRSIVCRDDGFEADGIRARKLILATGGSADPASGSDGNGFKLARELGLSIIKPLPALVKVCTGDPKEMAVTAGVRAKGNVMIVSSGCIASDSGEIQFTKDGLSGIPVFNVSRYISRALEDGQHVRLILDLMPEAGIKDIEYYVSDMRGGGAGSSRTVEEALSGLIHKKINAFICKRIGITAGTPVENMTPDVISRYASAVKALEYDIVSTYGFDQAQVTCGGVDFDEVDDDLQSIRIPGLYLSGEILDIDGPCGGYNLQWAWTSGYIAGSSAGRG